MASARPKPAVTIGCSALSLLLEMLPSMSSAGRVPVPEREVRESNNRLATVMTPDLGAHSGTTNT